MIEEKPAPLVPPEVDLRGLGGFMLRTDRLLASELVALGTAEECWAAVMLWCRAWQQTPAASLPNDDRVLASFSGTGRRWPKVRDMAMRGFVLCTDNRWYHRVLAEEALVAWDRRLEHREANDNKAERQKRWRERCKAVSDQLRALGVRVPSGASLDTLETLLRDAKTSTRDAFETVSETGREGKGQGSEGTEGQEQVAGSDASPPAGNGTAAIYIPLVDGSEFPIPSLMVAELDRLYPAVDAMQTLREIRGWNISNPKYRKTKSGILRHINTWFAKEQNKG